MKEVGPAGHNVNTYTNTIDYYLLSTGAHSVKPGVEVSLYTSHCFYWQKSLYCICLVKEKNVTFIKTR